MTPTLSNLRFALLTSVVFSTQALMPLRSQEVEASTPAQDTETQIVLQSRRSLPLSAVSVQGDGLVVTTPIGMYTIGQKIPLQAVDHVYGVKPAEINQAVALLLTDQPKEAKKLIEPIVLKHRPTAKFPGNFWLEAARTLLLANALNGDATATTAIGKEISEATPEPGNDPFVILGKALLLPALTTTVEDRELALRDLTTDVNPTEICAYASFFRGNLFLKEKRKSEALEAYLTGPCIFPSAGLILNAASEMQSADLLLAMSRPEESKLLLESALREAVDTSLNTEVKKRLESLK